MAKDFVKDSSEEEPVENASTESAQKRIEKLEKMMGELMAGVIQMNKNLTEGYKATVAAIQTNLAPLAQLGQMAQSQQQQQQSSNSQNSNDPVPNLQKAGYFQPNANGQNGQQNPLANLEAIAMIMKMFGGEQQGGNVFTQMGQRMFVEQTMGQIMERKAMYRMLWKKGLLTEGEVNDFDMLQGKLYGGLLGGGTMGGMTNGQSGQDNKST